MNDRASRQSKLALLIFQATSLVLLAETQALAGLPPAIRIQDNAVKQVEHWPRLATHSSSVPTLHQLHFLAHEASTGSDAFWRAPTRAEVIVRNELFGQEYSQFVASKCRFEYQDSQGFPAGFSTDERQNLNVGPGAWVTLASEHAACVNRMLCEVFLWDGVSIETPVVEVEKRADADKCLVGWDFSIAPQ